MLTSTNEMLFGNKLSRLRKLYVKGLDEINHFKNVMQAKNYEITRHDTDVIMSLRHNRFVSTHIE